MTQYHIQNTLFESERSTIDPYEEVLTKSYLSKEEKYGVLDTVDWDFEEFQTQYLSHRFHSYPARFIPQIPKTFIKLFTDDTDVVIDPFCGCGTTIVESFLNGRDSMGNDFNPLACLITKVKVRLIPEENIHLLEKKLMQIKRYIESDRRRSEYLKKLPRRNISNLFNRDMINELCFIKETLDDLRGQRDIYELGLVALSATIWTIIESENGVGIFNHFYKKILNMVNTIRQMENVMTKEPRVNVIHGDSRFLEIEPNVATLIVTSPPYVNALDYYRVHMYNMLWLGMDYEGFRKHEIGGHSHFIANRFRLLSEYLADMLRSMIEMKRVLKKGGICVIAIGNSSLEYELIESYRHFLAFAPRLNFKLVKTIYRNIDTTKKYTSREIGKIDNEYIIVLEKMDDMIITSRDDTFVEGVVTQQMKGFEEKVKKIQGLH